MTTEQSFINETYDKLRETILNFDSRLTRDIYALSFWKYDVMDDLRRPSVTVGFNTTEQWHSSTPAPGQEPGFPIASDAEEAKWNFSFWIQNEELIIGDEDPKFEEWVKQLPFYTEEEEDSEEAFELGEKIQEKFMDIIIRLSQRLHSEGVIKTKFGREIPIIIHEMEYYDLPLSWTKKGNPSELVLEFEHWVNSL